MASARNYVHIPQNGQSIFLRIDLFILIGCFEWDLRSIMPHIHSVPIRTVHDATLRPSAVQWFANTY